MKRSEIIFGLLRIPCDVLAVLSAILLAYWLRTQNIDLLPGIQLLEPAKTLPDLPTFIQRFIIPSVFLFLVLAAILKLYLIRATLSAFREQSRIALTTIVWVGLIMGWYFFVQKQLFYSRILLLHATFFMGIFVTVGRMTLTIIQRMLLKRGIGVRTVLSVGSISMPETVRIFLERDPRYRYGGHVHGKLITNNYQLTTNLIIQTDPSTSEETNELIDFCRSNHIGYAFLPPVLADVPHLLSVSRFGSVPILLFHPTPLDGWGAVIKRVGDIVISAAALILLSPFSLLIALCIAMDSRGSIFYRSRRIGQGGTQTISVLKFRSMIENADALKTVLSNKSHRTDGPLFKLRDDPRVTRVGMALRRWSLDELPQLWNVFCGSLSLIGPRPHLPEEVSRYTAFQKRVFAVKPGITGLAQISGRSDLPFAEEVRLDLQYIEEWSPWMDCWILWRTMWVVLCGKGAD